MKQKVKWMVVLSIVSILFSLQACLMPRNYTVGQPLKQNLIGKIQPFVTTKQQILDWFGLPHTILKPGEVAEIPYADSGGYVSGQNTQKISTDTLFELFASKHKITPNHRIYYYIYVKTSGMMVDFIIIHPDTSRTLTDKLLVLINEKTGLVEDYIISRKK